MKETAKEKVSLVKLVSRVNLISILLSGSLLAILCIGMIISRTNTDYRKIAETTSKHMAFMLNQIAEGDYSYDEETGELYKGDYLITDDVFKKLQSDDSDVHHTIFWGDERILTDVVNTAGETVVGTKLNNDIIMNAVKTDGIYTSNGVEIYGTKYTVCYYPLYNGNDMVGMMFIGINQSVTVKSIVVDVVVTVIFAILYAFVATNISGKIFKRKSVEFGENLSEISSITMSKKRAVSDIGNQTSESMKQIDIAIDQVSKAVTSQAGHTEEIMGTMEEFAGCIDIIIDHVQNTTAVAKESAEYVDALKHTIEEFEKVSAANSEEILSISQKIEEDNNAVAAISRIIDTINSIEFQIMLLSFNASVEAARAGEAGKGFAVVADNIKKLSNDTKVSLEEITKIVEQVIQQMESTSETSKVLITKNEEVVNSLATTKEEISSVTKAFNNITEEIQEVRRESDILLDSKNQVVETVSALAAASEENAAMSQQIKASSAEVIASTDVLLSEIQHLNSIEDIVCQVKNSFDETLK